VICQVIYGAHRHDCLPNRIDNRQGDNGPVIQRGDKFLDMLKQLYTNTHAHTERMQTFAHSKDA